MSVSFSFHAFLYIAYIPFLIHVGTFGMIIFSMYFLLYKRLKITRVSLKDEITKKPHLYFLLEVFKILVNEAPL